MKRLPERKARAAIVAFLRRELGRVPEFTMTKGGDDGWAWFIDAEDTTSYVHADGSIEWYGTTDGEPT